jgi:hypothetical protein
VTAPRYVILSAAAAALAIFAFCALAVRAQAAETVYWDNYSSNPDTVGFANIDGNGGGILNLGGVVIDGPEGMAYDSVTNRLFVANEEGPVDGQITFINLDGSGAGVFTAPGAPVEEPEGVAIDPVTRMIYWINTTPDTISWARLDGTAGGVLNTAGATVDGASRLALDPVAGRVYWGSNANVAASSIWFANLNNTGVGNLNIAGVTPPDEITGIAVDPAGGRVYWADSNLERAAFANLNGSGGADLGLAGAVFDEPYGLAFDPTLGKLYWGNYGKGEERTGAIGFGLLTGAGGGIDIASAPLSGPQDPVVLKSPVGAGAPTVTRNAKLRSQLTCSTGTWGADFPGSFVYQAPRTFAYQWTRNGSPIAAATAASFTAKTAGKYACVVTATNQAGAAAQISAAAQVKASKAKLTVKKKVTVKAGGVATFKLKIANQGDLKSKNAKACVKVPKSAKGELKAPKCKSLGKLKSGGKRSTTLKIKALPSAAGVYKVTFSVEGGAGKPAKSKIRVLPAP